MKCDYLPESTNEKGWTRYQCRRPKCRKLSCYTPQLPSEWRNYPVCKEWPPLNSPEWLAIFSAALGITQASAALDAWLHGGAKVEELPAGVKQPGVKQPGAVSLTEGPGTELKKLLDKLDISSCGACLEWVAWMNSIGVDGCRQNREQILTRLRTAYDEASVLTKLKAGTLALGQGLPLSLESLLEEAIRSAEALRS